MKRQISITVDNELLIDAKNKLKGGLFRNKSHLFEYALRQFLEHNIDENAEVTEK